VCGTTTHHAVAATIAAALCCEVTTAEVERFPDGELRPRVGNAHRDDVYVIAPTGTAVSEHVLELLLLVDACRRGGAARFTAVVPYFAYARQDRRARGGEAVGARLVADALVAAGAERLVVVDPHTLALEAMCSIRTEMITAVPVLAQALPAGLAEEAVVVAPDLGAVKLAQRYSALLQRPLAIVGKTRLTGERVAAEPSPHLALRERSVDGRADGRVDGRADVNLPRCRSRRPRRRPLVLEDGGQGASSAVADDAIVFARADDLLDRLGEAGASIRMNHRARR
jgi:ribose-phosphate pyrophosphokinase